MQEFQYKYGDRPLEGYTIQRAAGRGGFGEVYYAVSDSGRQVALKVIQNYEQTELRGISQCMNLKSPHLVTIFDVKYNQEEKPFVIMEYVSGASLRDLLNEAPGGIGEQKAAFFLRETAKGLSYLHDCGIVHRDLKPGNIFYENGYVKIGDYGLSKMISTGPHSQQTITVGTVHYMAPEIGAGCYDRSIDIYALGVLLYEMLTGQVPFFGSSPAEVLMKHMTAEPDLSQVNEPFKRVIRKALTKDPKERYQGVQEMVEDIFGADHVRHSVSEFSPDSLTVYADNVARKVKEAAPPNVGRKPGAEPPDSWERVGRRVGQAGDRMAAGLRRHAHWRYEKGIHPDLRAAVTADPVSSHQRRVLSLITMALVALGAGILNGGNPDDWFRLGSMTFLMMLGASFGILLVRWRWLPQLESAHLRNILANALGIILAILLSSPFWAGRIEHLAKGTCFSLAVLVFANWWKITDPLRKDRVVLGHAIWLGVLGFIAASIFGGHPILIIGVVAGTTLVAQISSPYIPRNARSGMAAVAAQKPFPADYARSASPTPPRGTSEASPAYPSPPGAPPARSGHRPLREVHPIARIFWLIAFMILLGTGMMLLIWTGMENMHEEEFTLAVSFGVGSLLFSLFCLVKSFRRYFSGWYRYLVKPLLLLICAQCIFTAAMCLGMINMRGEEVLIALFFIIFPGIIFLVVAFLPVRLFEEAISRSIPPAPTSTDRPESVSPFKRVWALILSAGIFFCVGGLHRFYVGKIGTGILWLLTGGLLGVGQFIDILLILFGRFRDINGLPLIIWESPDELRHRRRHSAAAVRSGDVPLPPSAPGQPQPVRNVEPAAAPPLRESDYRPPVSEPFTPAPSSVINTVYREPFSIVSFLFSGLGSILLLIFMLLGLALALHVPAMIAAGIPDREVAQELDRLFGGPGWPDILRQIGFGAATFFLVLAVVAFAIARRRSGAAHVVRGALGNLGFFAALWALASSIPSHYDQYLIQLFQEEKYGPALNSLLQRTDGTGLIFTTVIFVVSVVILAWPPKKKEFVFPNPLPDQSPHPAPQTAP